MGLGDKCDVARGIAESELTVGQRLAALSQRLADPALEFVILGEGNASTVLDAHRLLVKASGSRMRDATDTAFVAVDWARLLAGLDTQPDDAGWKAALTEASAGSLRPPSIEVAIHAVAVGVCGARWAAHTHPMAVNTILCSVRPDLLALPIFPEQVVICGSAYCLVPYVDPGHQLGVAFRDAVITHRARHGDWPRVVLLENHGMIALGEGADDVFNITAMMVKAAAIAGGAAAIGGTRPLADASVQRLAGREDEAARAAMLRGTSP